jgi:hypothetical protein
MSGVSKRKTGEMKRNILIFGIFLILSFLFWYLNSLGKTIEADLRYPVDFPDLNEIERKDINLPSKVSVTLAGKGYSILQLKISSSKSPLNIPVSLIETGRKANKSVDYIVTSDLLISFNSQLKSECKVTAIKPDTIWLGDNTPATNR